MIDEYITKLDAIQDSDKDIPGHNNELAVS
jgi:hypothetical protein